VTRRAWIAFATCSVLWGIPYFFIKVAVDDLPAVFVAWARIALGAAILLPLAWRQGALGGIWERRWLVAAFGLIEIAGPFTLIPLGERHLSSSLAAILIAAVPLTVAILAVRFAPEERVHGLRLLGLFVGLAGVVMLLGIDVAGKSDELVGALCILGATLGYAAGPMIAKKTLSDLPAIAPVAAALTISAIVLAPLAAFSLPDHAPPFKAWGSVVVLGIACTAIALVVFFILLTEAGPSRASVITYVNPVVAVALGVAFLDESLGAASAAGLALILAGSYISTGGSAGAGHGEPALVGDDHRLHAVPGAKLREDPLDVRLDGGLLDDELGGDLGIR
jgi:drug/metabolite transporter (DMT)-like permease